MAAGTYDPTGPSWRTSFPFGCAGARRRCCKVPGRIWPHCVLGAASFTGESAAGGLAHPGLFPQEVIVPEGKWRKVSPASLSLSLPDADYQCIHRTSVSSLSAKESSFTSEEPLVSGEGCV